MRHLGVKAVIAIVLATTGCSTIQPESQFRPQFTSNKTIPRLSSSAVHTVERGPQGVVESKLPIQFVSQVDEADPALPDSPDEFDIVDVPNLEDQAPEGPSLPVEPAPAPSEAEIPTGTVQLGEVVTSVHQSYPLLVAALLEGDIADGNQLATWGAFDTKLKGGSENGPTGFYKTYRHDAGFNQPIYHGGEFFGGYRIGRGFFEPWYLERQTNDAGEFKAGIRIPLSRDRTIDARRAELWRATYDQQRVRPEIRAQLIEFVREASFIYWEWIAAGRRYEIGERALELSQERNDRFQRRVEEGDLDPPIFQDNLRSIAEREAKLIDRGRKLQQSAVKLSLFLRALNGAPIVPQTSQLGEFPEPERVPESQLNSDIEAALIQRPELAALDALRRRISVDLAQACNDFLPSIDAQFAGSQDLGEPTSSKRDKSEFELEAGVFVEVPLQRRKARGKAHAARAKLSQVAAKRRFTQDKIVAEVQFVYAGLTAAYERVGKAREAKRLAEYMADIERRKFELGQTDLLSVFLREQSAIEAADGEVNALLEYFIAEADYVAALAFDWPNAAGGP